MKNVSPRRKFIKQLAGSTMAVATGTNLLAAETKPLSLLNKQPAGLKPLVLAPSEDLVWDTMRGYFRMSFTLEPPASKWKEVSRKDPKKPTGEYGSDGYLLKINETANGNQAVCINFELSRSDGQLFKIFENKIECKTSYSGVYKLFTPGLMTQQNYRIDLPFGFNSQSRSQIDHPVIWMQETDGYNTLTLGMLDQIHTCNQEGSTYNPGNGGEAPGIANSYVRVSLNRAITTGEPITFYKDGLYVNANPGITWFEALEGYSEAVDAFRKFKVDPISDWALNPMWHSWYAHGDKIDEVRIREDAHLARKLGVTTVELDAGWNIPPTAPYSFDAEGDYIFDKERFPDPIGMIREMHDAGQRVILHVAPLLMGKDSKAWKDMQDCLIQVDGKPDAHLDPRLKKVHAYLLQAWESMFKTYDVDGLWYDFLEIPERADSIVAPEMMVSSDLHIAYTMLMQALYKKALEVNPNAVIILRRGSANLNSKTFCTHVWPMDVPQDYNMNRRDIVYMKTYGAGVLTHACCTSWAISESDVNVARQMASIVLAGVPAFSVILPESPETHNEIIKAWLNFYEANKQDLVLGRMTPGLPTPPSAILHIASEKQAFLGFFEAVPGLVEIEPVQKITIVNAFNKRTVTRLEGLTGRWNAQTYDQVWRPLERKTLKVDNKGGLSINITGSTACHTVILTKEG